MSQVPQYTPFAFMRSFYLMIGMFLTTLGTADVFVAGDYFWGAVRLGLGFANILFYFRSTAKEDAAKNQ